MAQTPTERIKETLRSPRHVLPRRIHRLSVTIEPFDYVFPRGPEGQVTVTVEINGVKHSVREVFPTLDDFDSRFDRWLEYAVINLKELVNSYRKDEERAQGTLDRGHDPGQHSDNQK